MSLSIVVAAAENNVIGNADGAIPWHIKTDSRFFKNLTMGHPIVMGRRTFVSPPLDCKPLPGRTNIVLSRSNTIKTEGVIVVHSAAEALKEAASSVGGDEIFIIGGADIYRTFLPSIDRIYLTRVQATPIGDTHFDFDDSEWFLKGNESHPADLENGDEYPFTFLTYERKQPDMS